MPRQSNILVRVSEGEKTLIRERAEASGQNMSEYLRGLALQGVRAEGERGKSQRQRNAERRAPGDFEALVARYSRTMPRRNAEIAARRELQRGG